MADDDEIDILSDFSFNSCLAQNNQGIPSCSDREDTVHPQWLLDSVSANWYDQRGGPSRRVTGIKAREPPRNQQIVWSNNERLALAREMAKYGRNVRRISQTIKSKTEAEIQALIEAEYGIDLDTPSCELDKLEESDNVPSVAHEEIITEDMSINNIINLVTTASPTVPDVKSIKTKVFTKNTPNIRNKNSLLKPLVKKELVIDSSQILYEDDLIIGSTESVGNDIDPVDTIMQKMAKQQRAKVKKLGNHRRKVSRNYDNGKRNKSQELNKSPARQRKDSSLSEDSTKSPKMQIVLGSGQALPVSEGEEVIKIKKKEDAESESDIEIDVDSDNEEKICTRVETLQDKANSAEPETPVAVPLAKFEPMPRRQKKITLDGDGGYTIMHTAQGDLYAKGAEPRKERANKANKPKPVPLIHCRPYSTNRPAPFEVHLYVSALLIMDAHAHTSRAEIMGLVGGRSEWHRTVLSKYRAAKAAATGTHCDMEPVSQASAAEHISSAGLSVCAWHHSHPRFPPEPSALDLVTQRTLQRALERDNRPLLGIITSQQWPPGRTASQYRCIRVENPEEDTSEVPTGYQFSVKLVPDLTAQNLSVFLRELHSLVRSADRSEYSVDMLDDQCPQAKCTYLEKYVSSVNHHLRSAGYRAEDPFIAQIIDGVRDVFR